jgi:hypothetical protein
VGAYLQSCARAYWRAYSNQDDSKRENESARELEEEGALAEEDFESGCDSDVSRSERGRDENPSANDEEVEELRQHGPRARYKLPSTNGRVDNDESVARRAQEHAQVRNNECARENLMMNDGSLPARAQRRKRE